MPVFWRDVFHLQVRSHFHSENGSDVFLQILMLTVGAEGYNLDILILSGVNCFLFIILQRIITVRGNLNKSVTYFMYGD